MKRDMELIRKMLLAIEDHSDAWAPDPLEIDGHTDDEIGYHANLLGDAGLVVGYPEELMGRSGPMYTIRRLTWEGHEFIDVAREDTRWKKAMGVVTEKAGSITFEVLKALLVSYMKSAVGLGPK
jgi:hypothetical protein